MAIAASILDYLPEEDSKLALRMKLVSAVAACSSDAEPLVNEPGTLAKCRIVLGKPSTSRENKHARLPKAAGVPRVQIVERGQVRRP